MSLIRQTPIINIQLSKDLTRSIKRGHTWLFSDAVKSLAAPAGSIVKILDRGGETIGVGMYCRDHPIVVRICRTEKPWVLDDQWIIGQLERALALRSCLFDNSTTGQRLVAGEGDGLPGLVVDRYADVAVVKLDGGAPESFYLPEGVAEWLAGRLQLRSVVFRPRGRGTTARSLIGDLPDFPIPFLENGLRFTADVVHGQKTGFFLDQRDNRQLIRSMAAGKRVLNLFSFSGGFSVAAGVGQALHVTSVDVAAAAIRSAIDHWHMNDLPAERHQAIAADCFEYLQAAGSSGERWDLVICDPPSFAPSQQSQAAALSAYSRLAQLAANVVRPAGLLALASCSSHVDNTSFLRANLEGIGRARRVARIIADRNLPADHPTPLAMPELRYLKFHLLQL